MPWRRCSRRSRHRGERRRNCGAWRGPWRSAQAGSKRWGRARETASPADAPMAPRAGRSGRRRHPRRRAPPDVWLPRGVRGRAPVRRAVPGTHDPPAGCGRPRRARARRCAVVRADARSPDARVPRPPSRDPQDAAQARSLARAGPRLRQLAAAQGTRQDAAREVEQDAALMAASASFRAFVLEQLGRVVERVRGRSMFGGVGIYASDVFFALIADDVLYLKVDALNRPEFEARGRVPFRPLGERGETMQYYPLPDDVLDDVEALRPWVEKAIAAAGRKRRRPPARCGKGGADAARS